MRAGVGIEYVDPKRAAAVAKILLADDDTTMAEQVSRWLSTVDRHIVETVNNGAEALSRLKIYEYDLAVLDWKMPGCTGIEVCKSLRSINKHLPVLMLTSNASISDKETGFGCGADDYLTKPFELKELSLRIQALLRRPAHISADVFTVGDVQLDSNTQKVFKAGQVVDLTIKEYCVLEVLMRSKGRFMSPEEIANKVWSSESDVSPLAVKTVISRLRAKLDTDAENSVIQSAYGRGYCIAGGSLGS